MRNIIFAAVIALTSPASAWETTVTEDPSTGFVKAEITSGNTQDEVIFYAQCRRGNDLAGLFLVTAARNENDPETAISRITSDGNMKLERETRAVRHDPLIGSGSIMLPLDSLVEILTETESFLTVQLELSEFYTTTFDAIYAQSAVRKFVAACLPRAHAE